MSLEIVLRSCVGALIMVLAWTSSVAQNADTKTAPNLDDALNFIEGSINGQGTLELEIEFPGNSTIHHSRNLAKVTRDGGSCVLLYENTQDFDSHPPERNGPYRIFLTDLDQVAVGQSGFVRSVLAVKITTHRPFATIDGHDFRSTGLYFADRNLADRVASAFRHAARLCGAHGQFESGEEVDFLRPGSADSDLVLESQPWITKEGPALLDFRSHCDSSTSEWTVQIRNRWDSKMHVSLEVPGGSLASGTPQALLLRGNAVFGFSATSKDGCKKLHVRAVAQPVRGADGYEFSARRHDFERDKVSVSQVGGMNWAEALAVGTAQGLSQQRSAEVAPGDTTYQSTNTANDRESASVQAAQSDQSRSSSATTSQYVPAFEPGQCARDLYVSGQLWIINNCGAPVTVHWTTNSGNSFGTTDVGPNNRRMVSSADVGYEPRRDGTVWLFTCPQGATPVPFDGSSFMPNNYKGQFRCRR